MPVVEFALLWVVAILFFTLKAFGCIDGDLILWSIFIAIMVLLGLPVVLAVIVLFAALLTQMPLKYQCQVYEWKRCVFRWFSRW